MATISNSVARPITIAGFPPPNTHHAPSGLITEPVMESPAEPVGINGKHCANGTCSARELISGSMVPLPLEGRVAIVTGGSGGIGSEICRHLASLGAKLVISYFGDRTPAHSLVSEIINSSTRTHPQAIAVETDVSEPAQVKALFDRAEQAFGRGIHILVAAAGVQDAKYPALADTSLDSWEHTFNVNAKGTFLCVREAANRLVRGGGGRIITMSSSNVGSLRPGYSAYAASKGAVEVMTRIVAKELSGTRITANAVAPGPVGTPMFYAGKTEERIQAAAAQSPMGRVGEPTDVAPLVAFLATDAAEWVNGQVIRINGGYV